MPVRVVDVSVVVAEVPAVEIVDVTVTVVIDAVAVDFSRIAPQNRVEVRMIHIDAGIVDRDHHPGAPFVDVPRLGCVDVGVRGLVQMPLVAKHRISGNPARLAEMVRLRVVNFDQLTESLDERAHVASDRDVEPVGPVEPPATERLWIGRHPGRHP